MKLIIAADIFPPESGGPATYSVTLANELVKQGVEVTIVSLNPHSDKKVLDDKVELVAVASRFKPLRYRQYYKLLLAKGKSADIIYAMGPVNAGYPALRAARKLGKKFVVKVVGDYAWEQGVAQYGITALIDDFQYEKKSFNKVGVLRRIESSVVRRADHVITPCNYLRKMVLGWGAINDKVTVVYNAVEFKKAEPKMHSGERWVVSVARLLPWKGMEALVEAVSMLVKDSHYANLKLKIIGDGPEMGALKNKVATLKAENFVELLGNKRRTEALEYIAGADLFVLNSSYEGMSHAILEAQALGIPVLASKKGGNPELVASDRLFTYNNADEIKNKIKELLDENPVRITPVETLKYSDTGISLKKFTVGTMIGETKDLLEHICAS